MATTYHKVGDKYFKHCYSFCSWVWRNGTLHAHHIDWTLFQTAFNSFYWCLHVNSKHEMKVAVIPFGSPCFPFQTEREENTLLKPWLPMVTEEVTFLFDPVGRKGESGPLMIKPLCLPNVCLHYDTANSHLPSLSYTKKLQRNKSIFSKVDYYPLVVHI